MPKHEHKQLAPDSTLSKEQWDKLHADFDRDVASGPEEDAPADADASDDEKGGDDGKAGA